MIVRYAPWHGLEPTAQVIPAGRVAPVTLGDVAHILHPGEIVTVLEPEHDDALAILAAHFDLTVLEY